MKKNKNNKLILTYKNKSVLLKIKKIRQNS